MSADELAKRILKVLENGGLPFRIRGTIDLYLDHEPPPVDPPIDPPVDPPVDPPPVDPPPTNGHFQRPSYNHGTGCFVVRGTNGGRDILADGNGREFYIRGTNKLHPDQYSGALTLTLSNTTRINAFNEPWIPWNAKAFVDGVLSRWPGGLVDDCIQVPGFWDGTCKDDPALLKKMVDRWIAGIAEFNRIERCMILNPANEYGKNREQWRDQYIQAIAQLRAAGWNGCIMVDAPGCGQDGPAIAQYGRAIFDSDPQKNVIFSWHIYSAVYDSIGGIPKSYAEQCDFIPTLDAIANTGLVCVIGEFGPNYQFGNDPQRIDPKRIVEQAELRGMGWLSWAWDDHNKENSMADDTWYGHVYNGNLAELGDNLTKWGEVVNDLWAQYGAAKASVF